MDRITNSYLQDFIKSQDIKNLSIEKEFELFSGYCSVCNEYKESFDVNDIVCGDGNDCGIDGIAIIVNGKLVTTPEEFDDLVSIIPSILTIKIILFQSTISDSFDGSKIRTFGDGVIDLFSENHRLVQNDFIKEKSHIIDKIINKLPSTKQLPECQLYYTCTGKWTEDKNILAKIDMCKLDLQELHLFGKIEFNPVDADKIQDLYRKTKEALTKEIEILDKVQLPQVNEVSDSYFIIVKASEYIKLLVDNDQHILESVFYDNVRAFLGKDNKINEEIEETIKGEFPDRFVLLNNGVTIICKDLMIVRDKVTLKNYQIVNGCQTSHVLYKNKDDKNITKVFIPVKIVSTHNEDCILDVIRSTNRQTPVLDEQFIICDNFFKKLESFYETFQNEQKLYFERRTNQFCDDEKIEKTRIISIAAQIKTYAAMYFDKPHIACRYYGKLVNDIDGLFDKNNKLLPYYTSAYTLYKLEVFFRKKEIDIKFRKYRYHILMMFKYDCLGDQQKKIDLNSREIDKLAEKMNNLCNSHDLFLQSILHITSIIAAEVGNINDTEQTKLGTLTEKLIRHMKGVHSKNESN